MAKAYKRGHTGNSRPKDNRASSHRPRALISMWFVLQADIAEAEKLPEPAAPEITRMEFDMKDQLVRQTIMSTQEDVTEIKQDIKRIEEKIDQLK